MNEAAPAARGGVAALLDEGLALGLAASFALWVLAGDPVTLADVHAGLLAYGHWILPGFALGAALTALLNFWAAAVPWRAALSRSTLLVYLGSVKALGWSAAAWVVVALAVVACAWPHKPSGSRRAQGVLLLHAMGTMSALYVGFHAAAIRDALPAFVEVLRALLALAGGTGG